MDKDSAVSRLPYWDKLDDKQKKFIGDHAVIRKYAKGEYVHGYGSTCLGPLLVLTGSLRVFLLSEDGREITLFSLKEGDPCILSASCVISRITFDTNMVAESDSELLVINSAAFDKIAKENVYVRCFMYEVATERFSSVMWTMQQILFLKIDKRLSNYLLSEYRKNGNREIKTTHEQIAVQISSAREVVARMLKRFEGEGLVKLGRGSIILEDIEGLEKI